VLHPPPLHGPLSPTLREQIGKQLLGFKFVRRPLRADFVFLLERTLTLSFLFLKNPSNVWNQT
jgi:hypothetical protein